MTRRLVLLALAGLLALVAGCSGPTFQPAATPTSTPAAAVAAPYSLDVPAIGARSRLVETGLNADGTVEVPPVEQPEQASWFGQSPRPGQPGPAVLLGHVDGAGRPGVFVNLSRLVVGDEVFVDRVDGSRARFTVYKVDTVDKDRFPTGAVYGNTERAELRLITCGGEFVGGDQGYADNVIAYAREVL